MDKLKISDSESIVRIQYEIVRQAASIEKKTKLAKALVNHNAPILESKKKYIDSVMDKKRLEFALTGPNGEVLEGKDGKFLFNKDGMKDLKESLDSILKTEISEELFVVNFSDLSKEEKNVICDNEDPGDMKLGWTENDVKYLNKIIKF